MTLSIRTAALVAACLLLITSASPFTTRGEEQATDKNQPTNFWMRKKLEYSQNILAGITSADLDKVVANAEAMRKLSAIEGFLHGQTPGYRTQLHIFEESADEIIRQGKKDNVEGAALAFTQLTISCVNCHKQLRELQQPKP
jgi:hypothetical protein